MRRTTAHVPLLFYFYLVCGRLFGFRAQLGSCCAATAGVWAQAKRISQHRGTGRGAVRPYSSVEAEERGGYTRALTRGARGVFGYRTAEGFTEGYARELCL